MVQEEKELLPSLLHRKTGWDWRTSSVLPKVLNLKGKSQSHDEEWLVSLLVEDLFYVATYKKQSKQ